LTPVPGSPFAAGAYAFSAAIDPSGKFAYVVNVCSSNVNSGCIGNGNVSAYTIDGTTGALAPIPGSPFAGGQDSLSVAVDPSGKFAYVANDTDSISIYGIDSATGALSQVPGLAYTAPTVPVAVAVDPLGRFAFTANSCGIGICANGSVSANTINGNTGALTPVPGSPFYAGRTPVAVAADPSGKFVYVVNGGAGDGGVWVYAIDSASGTLTQVGSSVLAGQESTSLAIVGQSSVPFEDLDRKSVV
jgi:DNA-binding beta-propeller fold protein YncE